MAKKENKPKEDSNKKLSGMLVPAFLLIGIGIGLAIDQVAAATLIGLGVGFLAAYLAGSKK